MLGLFLSAVLMPGLQSRQALFATIAGLLFVAWATGSKLWFNGDVWAFGWHAMMIGVVGTLLIIGTSYVLQLFGLLQSPEVAQTSKRG
jgi:SSS family solute:Na+ symporter